MINVSNSLRVLFISFISLRLLVIDSLRSIHCPTREELSLFFFRKKNVIKDKNNFFFSKDLILHKEIDARNFDSIREKIKLDDVVVIIENGKLSIYKFFHFLSKFRIFLKNDTFHKYKPSNMGRNLCSVPMVEYGTIQNQHNVTLFENLTHITSTRNSEHTITGIANYSLSCGSFDHTKKHFLNCKECQRKYSDLYTIIPHGAIIKSIEKQNNNTVIITWHLTGVKFMTDLYDIFNSTDLAKCYLIPMWTLIKNNDHPMRHNILNSIVLVNVNSNNYRFAYVTKIIGDKVQVTFENNESIEEYRLSEIIIVDMHKRHKPKSDVIKKRKRDGSGFIKYPYYVIQISKKYLEIGFKTWICSSHANIKSDIIQEILI